MMRSLLAKLTVVVVMVAASVVAGAGVAAAGTTGHRPPNLVVLGDSFAAGTGNTPYQPDDGECDRSKSDAYGELLARFRLVTLQAFVACQGAKTTDVLATQLGAITADTDVVTVQAFGNDAGFGLLAGYCLTQDCSLNGPNGATVNGILAAVPTVAAQTIPPLFTAIKGKVGPRTRVIVVDYGDPLPTPGTRIGPFCSGLITAGEPEVAQQFADAVNTELATAAARYGFTYANAAPKFRGLDICGLATAFFRPAGPGAPTPEGYRGALHPNKIGQGIYAAVLTGKLY